jgi:hypothetical protein
MTDRRETCTRREWLRVNGWEPLTLSQDGDTWCLLEKVNGRRTQTQKLHLTHAEAVQVVYRETGEPMEGA